VGFWNAYQRYAKQVDFLDALVKQNPHLTARFELGTSYKGRTIVGITIGTSFSNSQQKPVIWIEGGIHAREWITPATVTYFAQQLVNKFNAGDSVVVAILNYFGIYIMPVLNSDGYEFSHQNNSLEVSHLNSKLRESTLHLFHLVPFVAQNPWAILS